MQPAIFTVLLLVPAHTNSDANPDRLVRHATDAANLLGTAVLDPDGRVSAGTLGDLVAQYTYDGLGRLIHKQTPVAAGQPDLQTKHLYYDGVRRIAEVIGRPGVCYPRASSARHWAIFAITWSRCRHI